MTALKKTVERPTRSTPHSNASPKRVALATAQSEPVESAAHQLRSKLEAALAAQRQDASTAEPEVETWPRPMRAAILAGAVILPWSLIAVAAHALIGRRLF
jgi:hypothetical protein